MIQFYIEKAPTEKNVFPEVLFAFIVVQKLLNRVQKLHQYITVGVSRGTG
jgi:hypothetical protein